MNEKNGTVELVRETPESGDGDSPHELLIPFTEKDHTANAEASANQSSKTDSPPISCGESTETAERIETDAITVLPEQGGCHLDDKPVFSAQNPASSMPSRAPRWKMLAALAAVLIATAAVIVYGVFVKDVVGNAVKRVDSLPSVLIGEVFGRGVTRYNEGKTVTLRRIPLPRIIDEENPGASEEEHVPNVDDEDSEADRTGLRIKEVDLSVGESGIFTIINETGYSPELTKLLTAPFPIQDAASLNSEYGADAPLVLILHTHGSESFSPEGQSEASADESFRSDNPEDGVVSVGKAFAETLRSWGIGVVHIETMFDIEDYNSAYMKSAAAVKEYLEKYPSVRYVFDIHRDALITESGENLKPTAYDGEAQVMLVVGTDYGGANHPNWESNLVVALRIQEAAGTKTPSLVRGINLRSPSFNEQYAPGSLLLEIGAAGNTLGEAEAAARLMGDAVAEVIISAGN